MVLRECNGQKETLEKEWESMHQMILQEDLPKSNAQSKQLTLCRQLGTCVCTGNGLEAAYCQKQLATFLKPIFQVPRKRKNQVLTAEQKAQREKLQRHHKLLSDGFIVLRIEYCQAPGFSEVGLGNDCSESDCLHEWSQLALQSLSSFPTAKPPDNASDLWVHLGYINFSAWQATVLPMELADSCESGNYLLTVPAEPSFEHLILLFMKALDMNLVLEMSLFLICSDNTLLSLDEMKPNQVLVQPFEGQSKTTFWRGSHEERRKREEKQQPAQRKRKASSQQSSSKRTRVTRGNAAAADANSAALPAVDDIPNQEPLAPVEEPEIEEVEIQEVDMFYDEELQLSEDIPELEGDNVAAEPNASDNESEASVFQDGPNDTDAQGGTSSSSKQPKEPSRSSTDSVPKEQRVPPSTSSDPSCAAVVETPVQPLAPLTEKKDVDAKGTRASSVRTAPANKVDVLLDGKMVGQIHFYENNKSFTAFCRDPGHLDCRRSRTSLESKNPNTRKRAGQGRPLGMLAAWLAESSSYASASEHVHAHVDVTDLTQRKKAREMLLALEGGTSLAEKERPQRPGEAEEPEGIL